jgi:hypothetical protein
MSEPEILREILERSLVRYLDVRPGGILLHGRLRPEKEALVSSFGGARTLYRGRKPFCRSLDGLKAIRGGKLCSECHERKHCTPQVRVDLAIDGRPFRLLLSFTSAKNFLLYASRLTQEGATVEAVTTRIRVLDRGSWGELRFSRTDAGPAATSDNRP